MNNKPVAWIGTEAIETDWDFVPVTKNKRFDSDVPLYAHLKDLTDEEIDSLIAEVAEKPTDEDLYDFARAILKKAQE